MPFSKDCASALEAVRGIPALSSPSLKWVVQMARDPVRSLPLYVKPASLCTASESSMGTILPAIVGMYTEPPASQLVISGRVLISSL